MANIVVGVFEDDSNLQDAVSELLVSGFLREQVHPFAPRTADSSVVMPGGQADSEAGRYQRLESASPMLGNALAEYDEQAVYDDLLGHGRFILAVHAESEDRVDRAVEVMSRHWPVDISEYHSSADGEAPMGRTDTAVAPEAPAEVIRSESQQRKSGRRSGRIRIF